MSFGAFAFFLTTSPIAFSDTASLLSGADQGGARWNSYLVEAPAGSLHSVEMAFTDDITTGSTIADKGVRLPNGGTAAIRTRHGTKNPVPDEQRINRSQKRGRVTTEVPMAPPKDFSAGSVLQESNLLLKPQRQNLPEMAFVKAQFPKSMRR